MMVSMTVEMKRHVIPGRYNTCARITQTTNQHALTAGHEILHDISLASLPSKIKVQLGLALALSLTIRISTRMKLPLQQ